MNHSVITILVFVIFLLIYTVKGIITLDSDFGWHIRMGQIILESGIPKTDPFSYTMPSYPFVDHEWLTDVGIAIAYPIIGMGGLSIIFATLACSAFFLQIRRTLNRWAVLPMILIFASMFSITGVRMQLISWFFLSCLILIIAAYSKNRIIKYLPIPLMLIWSNLHGGFPVGLLLLSIFYATRWLHNRKHIGKEISILLITIAVTLINPYGYMLWWEEWMVFSDRTLRFSILEWFPAFMFVNVTLWMYITISIMVTARYRHRFSLYEKVAYIVFFVAGVSSYRHMPLWMIVSLYPTLTAMQYFYQEIKKYKYGTKRLTVFLNILTTVAVLAASWEIGLYFAGYGQSSETRNYPVQAIAYIKNNLPSGNIFTTYEWGGYLDWKLPEKKVFIDGRMPSSRRLNPPPNESAHAFKEYQRAMHGSPKEFNEIMKKYNIEMVLMPQKRNSITDTFNTLLLKLLQQNGKAIKNPPENKFKQFSIVYQDPIATVYMLRKSK